MNKGMDTFMIVISPMVLRHSTKLIFDFDKKTSRLS